ncbi:DEKNAAC104537 [Brettanomyces naardenensis]|uniref:DEKNAAC104537 n=1 Tax=Brettanomyces naardenensis TaxID=13370 RepID=A0A448YR50_BRENA|nr:DEKNAAC104537 [Brettanomyces naardenensis]
MVENDGTGPGATMSSSIINTVNSVIGSGMLVLPYAFRTDSILLGTILLLFAAITNAVGLVIQGMSSKFLKQGNATFFTVCMITYPQLSVLFDIAIFLQCYGVAISYLVLTGDLMPLVYSIDGWSPEKMRVLYILGSAAITVPLCFLHKLDSLKYASVIALVAIAYLVLLIYFNLFYSWVNHFENVPIDKLGPVSFFQPQGIRPVFKTLGVIVLAYTCPNEYGIVSELQTPTLTRIIRIVYVSMSITVALFFTVSLFGYLNFGNAIKGNIILMYGDNFYSNLGRLLLVLMVLLSFPLMFHPARVSCNNIYCAIKGWLLEGDSKENDEQSPLLDAAVHDQDPITVESQEGDNIGEQDVPLPDSRFIWLTVLMLIVAYCISVSLNSFELILSLVGATGGVLISYVLPGFYGYKLIDTDDPTLNERLEAHGGEDSSHWLFRSRGLKLFCLGLIVWGLVSMVICVYSSLFE